jgi:hypothetical protein
MLLLKRTWRCACVADIVNAKLIAPSEARTARAGKRAGMLLPRMIISAY